jgi:transcriptional regulator with XRE-family HTH domain
MPATNALGPMVRIKEVRAAHNLTLVQLSERIREQGVEISESGISNVENGNKRPSDRLLTAWARALDLEPLDVWQGPLRPPVQPGTPRPAKAMA